MYLRCLMLSLLLFTSSQSLTIYEVCDKIGSVTDLIYTKGDIDKEDEALFKEVAQSLGIADRKVKPKNSGLLVRLLMGYNNAAAISLFNRVYLNASCLKKMTTEEKRYLMAHELSHHKNHDSWKIAGLNLLKLYVTSEIAKSLTSSDGVKTHSPFYGRYFLEGFTVAFLFELSLKSLLFGQALQKIELEADRLAITRGGASAQAAASCLHDMYHPDTTDWPLYAKAVNKISQIFMPIYSLPIIKEHMPHLTCLEDRVAYLSSVPQNGS